MLFNFINLMFVGFLLYNDKIVCKSNINTNGTEIVKKFRVSPDFKQSYLHLDEVTYFFYHSFNYDSVKYFVYNQIFVYANAQRRS